MANAKTDNLTLTSRQVRKSLLTAFKIHRPVFLWGPPGIGKSDVVKSVARELKAHVIDIRMAQCEPTDLRGIPFFNKELNKMDWAPPIELPDAEMASKYPLIVLFLDEMNSAAPAVQAAAYQLVLDRRVGTYVLPDNVVIVAAGNRESDKGVTYRMPTPLSNRFLHIEMRSDFDSWQDWAVLNNVHQDVVGYLNFAKNDLYDFDSKSSSRAFATPRTWTFVSDIINFDDADIDTQFNLISGAVGDGLAVKFSTHRKYASKLPNPADILSGKVKTLNTKEISAMYSLTVSMCYELVELNKTLDYKDFSKAFSNFLQYMMDNFETELVVMGAKLALKTHKIDIEIQDVDCFEEFGQRYGKYLHSA